MIGAGLIGLSCAWRARKRGLSVLVVDRADAPGAGTSQVAAGMLAPVTEADFGGNLTVRNHPDGGAVFSIVLEASAPSREAAE